MPTLEDLKEAVDHGVINAEQFAKLQKFQNQKRGQISLQAADEAPRFFRSFNDIFIGIGVIVFAIALMTLVFKLEAGPIGFGIAAVLIWLMAEWLTGYLKINFPSILLVSFFTLFCVLAFHLFVFDEVFPKGMMDPSFGLGNYYIGLSLVTVAAAGLFFFRFQLPFSLFIIAMALAYFISFILLSWLLPDMKDWDKLSSTMIVINLISFCVALALFFAAMWFDMKDPLRVGRYSDNGFWLHLAAGPMLASSSIYVLMTPFIMNTMDKVSISVNKGFWGNFSGAFDAFVIISFLVFVVLSVVSLIIDRRAMLISSIIAVGMSIGYIMAELNLDASIVLAVSLLLVSGIILFLGVGWHRLRSALFKQLPSYKIFQKLPPLINEPTD